MDVNFIKSFNSGRAVNFVEKRSLLGGRVVSSYELAKPSQFNFLNSISRIFSSIFYRQRNEVVSLSKEDGHSKQFLNLLSDDFKTHSKDPNWIKQIIPTIETLEKVHETAPLFHCISDLKTVLDAYLREHPISESSSELIKGDAKLLLYAIEKQPKVLKYANEQLRNDPTFVLKAYLQNNDSLNYAPLDVIMKIVKDFPSYLIYLTEDNLLKVINSGNIDLIIQHTLKFNKPKIAEACLEKKPEMFVNLSRENKQNCQFIEKVFGTIIHSSNPSLSKERKEEIYNMASRYLALISTFEEQTRFMQDLAKVIPPETLRDYIKKKYPSLINLSIASSPIVPVIRGRRSW